MGKSGGDAAVPILSLVKERTGMVASSEVIDRGLVWVLREVGLKVEEEEERFGRKMKEEKHERDEGGAVVLMQIKDEETLAFPGKLKGDPNKRPRNKYCRFHQDHGHDTANCYDLKQQIEALIRRGRLQRFVSKERADLPQNQAPRRDNDRPRQPIGDIRMIVEGTMTVGSSKKARKTYLRTVQNVQMTSSALKMLRIDSPPIGFSEEDARRLHHPHDDALVVTIQTEDYNIHRVLIDKGSSADILYYPAFQQMGIGRERLVPTNAPLVGFRGARVLPLGVVTLAVTIRDYP
ncbi:uncharacterized protein LOC142608646 [Castanea sativa]|uniref:uncharacterized protein LOC142608646 n=1 Tax=Castanea sativa TaxID=21020 RepID=UPI003F652637